MKRLIKWWRQRQFERAYMILRRTADRHRAADHMVEFTAVNQAWIKLECPLCPDPTL